MPNQYVNKVVQRDGTTLIDISDTTAVTSDVVQGKYFYTANGQKVSGGIASKTSSDLTVSDATVTVPSGYYASNASVSVPFSVITVSSSDPSGGNNGDIWIKTV